MTRKFFLKKANCEERAQKMWFPVQRKKIICEIGSKDRRSEKRVNFVWTCEQNICKWRWWLEKVYSLLKILFLTPSQQDLMAHVSFPLFSVIVNYWLLSKNLHQIQHIFFVFLFWIKKGYQQEKILNEDENLSCPIWKHHVKSDSISRIFLNCEPWVLFYLNFGIRFHCW